ncbi:hypothetical protein ACFQ36_01025 [Arthrobacter sp. GCM10027362]|uniref:hypothetical protein n=1 Tax=Arthrobacter sp. GCM10027362 TaxID=3273379 RepID=UPI00364144CB
MQFGLRNEPQLFWHHQPDSLVEIFQGRDGEAIWSPGFGALAIASNHGMLLYNLARPDEVRPCRS